MAIFYSYVKLPEGNGEFMGFNADLIVALTCDFMGFVMI